jgi:hypothetical protein
MKTIYITIILLFFSSFSGINAEENNCKSALQKLKPSCNFLGKSAKKLKNYSENNKTIGQTLKNKGVIKDEKSLTLKELNKKYKPIKLGTLKELNKKHKPIKLGEPKK